MSISLPWSSYRPALAALALGAAAALFNAAPSRGQQSLPAISVIAPAAASRGPDTRVNLTLAVPAGAVLDRNPRFRVTDANGQTLELLPARFTQGLPNGAAYRDLHTELYPPGTYQVTAELVLAGPGGTTRIVASAPTTLVVPVR